MSRNPTTGRFHQNHRSFWAKPSVLFIKTIDGLSFPRQSRLNPDWLTKSSKLVNQSGLKPSMDFLRGINRFDEINPFGQKD